MSDEPQHPGLAHEPEPSRYSVDGVQNTRIKEVSDDMQKHLDACNESSAKVLEALLTLKSDIEAVRVMSIRNERILTWAGGFISAMVMTIFGILIRGLLT